MFKSISLQYLIEFFFSYKPSNPTSFLILSKMTSFRCKKHQNDVVLTFKKKKFVGANRSVRCEPAGSSDSPVRLPVHPVLVRFDQKTVFCIEPDRFCGRLTVQPVGPASPVRFSKHWREVIWELEINMLML